MPNDSRCVIYARYSSHAQREESIEQQVEVCRAYAERNGLEVAEVYADEARSGRSTFGRERFLQMVDDAQRGEWGSVVVYKLDRFARDRYDSAIYKRRLRDCGVVVRSATEAIPDGPEGRLMEAVVEGVAEWYSADLSQKTKRGMYANARKCMANGVPVFGYSVGSDGRYVVDEAQAAIVREVFALWLRGVDGASISREMASRGVRAASGVRPSRQWASKVVHDERYVGTYRFGDVVVEHGMPAIIDAEVWSAAQARRRASMAPSRTHDYPLAGRIYDHETGRPMGGYSATSKGRDYTYYAVHIGGRHLCVRQELIEGAVVRAVTDAFKSAALIDDVVERVEAIYSDGTTTREVADARRTIAEARRQEVNAARLMIEQPDLVPEALGEALRAVQERRKAAEAVIERSEAVRASREEVRDFLEHMAERCTPAEIIEHCVSSVVVYRDEHMVAVTLPIHEKALAPSAGVSAVGVWLPSEVLGSKSLAWRVSADWLHLFARVA